MSAELHSPIGLIAGNGSFPLEYVENAGKRGLEVVAVAHRGETDPALEGLVRRCEWIAVGQVGRALKFLRASGVRELAFVGGITKSTIVKGIRPDLRGMLLAWKLKTLKDDVLLRGLAQEVEQLGIRVISPTELLPESVPQGGKIAGRDLTSQEKADAKLGWEIAKMSGAHDIGQTVIVSRGVVAAIEAIEGTDAAIRRAGELAGAGSVVVKVAKPQQDLRLDLPAVGVQTVRSMVAAGARVLVLETGKALLADPQGIIEAAERADISIIAVDDPQSI